MNAGRRCKHKFELMERFIPLNEASRRCVQQFWSVSGERGHIEFAGEVG